MSLPLHQRPSHSRSYVGYTPLRVAKSTIAQGLGPKRMIALPIIAVIIIVLICMHLYYIATYPAQLIPPRDYYVTLLAALPSFPKSMHSQMTAALHPQPPVNNSIYGAGAKDTSAIPNRVFQTDKAPPDPMDTRTWEKNGFSRIFLDDAQALAWVIDHFGESEVTRTYRSLPKPILKADMLRYLVCLAEGGVYSDTDTRALMPLSHWADSSHVWHEETTDRQPIRVIVSIEGDFHIWRDKVALSEGVGFTKSGRHRGLQFVQWTIASQAFHPILIDAVRRIVETATVAKAWEIQHLRKVQALEAGGWSRKADAERNAKKPWDSDTKGDPLSIQEWTGPAVFTDAVLSYLFTVAGVKEVDLYKLNQPIQIGDVLILPIDGFNPLRSSLPNPMARVIHLFRGSWKDPWLFGIGGKKHKDDRLTQPTPSSAPPSRTYPISRRR